MSSPAVAEAPSRHAEAEWATRVELAALYRVMHLYGMNEMDAQRVAMIEDQMRASAHYHYDGSTEWAALLRKLDRTCPDYRT